MITDFTLEIVNEKAEDRALVQTFRAKASKTTLYYLKNTCI